MGESLGQQTPARKSEIRAETSESLSDSPDRAGNRRRIDGIQSVCALAAARANGRLQAASGAAARGGAGAASWYFKNAAGRGGAGVKFQLEELNLLKAWPQLMLRDGYYAMRVLVRIGTIPVG